MHRKSALTVAIIACTLAGCSLENVSERGESCPGLQDGSGKSLQFIVKDTNADGLRCSTPAECPEYQESFALSICPRDIPNCYQDMDDNYYCISCSSNQVACNGTCVDPNSNDHCGAKGKCNNPDSKSEDFYGKACDPDQRCEKGICTVTKCASEIVCDGYCVRNPDTDPDYCGAKGECNSGNPESWHYRGEKCGAHSTCVRGECKCDAGYINCGDTCIDPLKDKNHCLAKGSCDDDDPQSDNYIGQQCNTDEACYISGCAKTACDNPNETMCSTPDGVQCFDLMTDVEHCNDCDFSCKNLDGQKLLACDQGVCKYQCKDGLIDCGNDGEMHCVNADIDHEHCGQCGHACAADEVCRSGICFERGACDGNKCFSGTACVQTLNQCGSLCANCALLDNVDNGGSGVECTEEGICKVSLCLNGYHIAPNLQSCEENTDTACAALDSSDVKNCLTDMAEGTGVCTNGECILKQCNGDKHVYESTCEPNDNENCGAHGIKCNADKIKNGKTFSCSGGTCKVTVCADNYHIYNNTCEVNSIENCGQHGNNCKNVITGGTAACQNGTCVATSCDSNHHLYNKTCESDSASNCGEHGKKCSDPTPICKDKDCAVEKCTSKNLNKRCAENSICHRVGTGTPTCRTQSYIDKHCFSGDDGIKDDLNSVNCNNYKNDKERGVTGVCIYTGGDRVFTCQCKSSGKWFALVEDDSGLKKWKCR